MFSNSFNFGGSGFVDGAVQSTINPGFTGAAGGAGGTFGNVLSNLSAGINQNASQGISPFQQQNTQNLSPSQIAAQLSNAGPTSLLPLLGNSFIPRLIFPVAGLWSMVQGVKSFVAMNNDAKSLRNNNFDASALAYNQTRAQFDGLLSNTVYQQEQYPSNQY